jgi:hypothetical protein
MGYPIPFPKKFLCGFVRIPGVILEASGGFKPPKPPLGLLIASICCKSHNGSLSFMASDSESKNFFSLQMLVGEFYSILDSKINILLQMVSCLQFLNFSSKTSQVHMLFPILSILPNFSIIGCGYKPGKCVKI